ncbi:hypothetical protein J21TS7_51870 [Paenibacillus cineris]|uniref:Uncharacterized protein n=1 Tax=Paenibacillus cineris TaxID=237530 RepID=A0ABQ4LK25_9BACL|nr:hypothetical protein J21TS7_51870 [Paenibacillus cineris]
MEPILFGKSLLMILGSNTLHTAMANPRIAVPINRSTAPDKERMTIPTVRKMRAIKMIRSTPYFRPNFGTRGDNKANASKGTVVIRPANVFEI